MDPPCVESPAYGAGADAMSPHLVLSAEVQAARARAQPIVVLESSFLAQGLPRPLNLEAARAMVAAIRGQGAVPAMVAVLGGSVRVGLDDAEIEYLAVQPHIAKASRRDLGVLVGRGRDGATTVAAAVACAAMAGLELVATGGIGGVHRGGQDSLDVSADLRALGATPVAVVCSGAKSILDLPRTLEVLETESVPVVGFGTLDLPGFYVRETGLALEHRASGAGEAAMIMRAHFALGGKGIVFANPIPPEAALDAAELDGWIERAASDARAAGVSGKQHTPYLLARVAELSGGRTLAANVALLRSNARVGARIALAGAGL